MDYTFLLEYGQLKKVFRPDLSVLPWHQINIMKMIILEIITDFYYLSGIPKLTNKLS